MTTSVHRAVILAAGRGVRMMPLTTDCPKPMIPVQGRPLLERVLMSLRYAGIDEAVIIHGYLGQQIKDHFGDGARVGMRLHYLPQEALGGTGGALLLAESLCGDEPFLVHWGDILLAPANYPAIIGRFTQASPPPACLLAVNWVEDPCAGGAVYRDGERVVHVVEKPAPGTSSTHWNIGGAIAFSPAIWGALREGRAAVTHNEYVLTDAVELLIRDGHTVLAHEIMGERVHITRPDNLRALDQDPRIPAWEAICRNAIPSPETV